MESEKTNLQLLEEQHAALLDEIRTMDQKAIRVMSAVENNKSETFDPYRHRQHREKLKRQLPVLEIKKRRERDRVLKARREDTKQALHDLQPTLLETKALFHRAQEILEEAWKRHSLVELKASNLEQQLLIDYEDMKNNQRALRSLIREVTGVDEEEQQDSDHDGLPSTDNLLIRN